MDQEKQISLLSECLRLTQEETPFDSDEETLVPVGRYLDDTQFEKERDLLFRRRLNVVAQSSQLASPGDFITRDVVGTPVIIVRQQDGTAKAFINVCRHRGATVELREAGNCRRFVCPYHAWTYKTDGSLTAVRHVEGFPSLDVDRTRLVELSCLEVAGLVWICPDPNVEPTDVDADTHALGVELDGLGLTDSVVFASETRVWNANWKLIVDGGLESYHFRIAHRDTIAQFFPDNVSTFEFVGDHVRTVLPRQSILSLATRPQSEWKIRDHTHLVYAVAPNASILVQENHYELILMTPLAIDQTRLELMTIVPNPGPDGFSEKRSKFWRLNHEFTKKTLNEDFEIGEQIQRGMKTRANEAFRFAKFEGALTQWHERLNRSLQQD
ncbi:MAG: SRPBCC family protein [Polyangiales bacterium]